MKKELNELTPEELKWIPSITKAKETLDEYEKFDKKKDTVYGIVNNYVKFMDLVIDNENLRSDFEYEVPYRRLVRLNRLISAKELDLLNIDHVIFEGMCILINVIYLDSGKYDIFMKNPTSECIKSLGYDKYNLSVAKRIRLPTGIDTVVVPDYNSKGSSFIRYYSDWDYVTF